MDKTTDTAALSAHAAACEILRLMRASRAWSRIGRDGYANEMRAIANELARRTFGRPLRQTTR